jgi:hypothetical protein
MPTRDAIMRSLIEAVGNEIARRIAAEQGAEPADAPTVRLVMPDERMAARDEMGAR